MNDGVPDVAVVTGASRSVVADIQAKGGTACRPAAHRQRFSTAPQPGYSHGKGTEPDEVAAAVVLLMSDDAGYIAGAVLPVSGGP
jgi:NAD(P)-dependent dehydrogenase (short-subunit alcohol dehydrogenase family)